jgi:integrase
LLKTGKPRVIDLDAITVALLKAHRRERGALVLAYARDDAVVFGDHEGRTRHPERFSRVFAETVTRCRRDLGEDALPVLNLHGLRHTHATHLQMSRIASDATFGRSRERVLPAAQRAALGQARHHGSPRILRDLGCHHRLASGRTMLQPVRLQQIPE